MEKARIDNDNESLIDSCDDNKSSKLNAILAQLRNCSSNNYNNVYFIHTLKLMPLSLALTCYLSLPLDGIHQCVMDLHVPYRISLKIHFIIRHRMNETHCELIQFTLMFFFFILKKRLTINPKWLKLRHREIERERETERAEMFMYRWWQRRFLLAAVRRPTNYCSRSREENSSLIRNRQSSIIKWNFLLSDYRSFS